MLALGERLTRGGDIRSATRVGPELQTVLGLSMTSTSVGWVLLDREGPDAFTLDHDAFDVQSGAEGTAPDTSKHTAAARGAQAIATASGHKVGSVQMTWSEDIEADATALLKSLADLGFDNVVPIPLNQATQTWAIEAGRANEHDKTALCVLEPGTATIMVIATGAGSVRTAVTNTREHAADLVDWLTTIFNRDGWLPESLHLVGSRDDLDVVTGPIGDALPIPVFDSVDTQLALARGAALAATHSHVAAGSSQVAATPRSDLRPQRDRPWLVSNAKRVTTSAAAVAIVGAALSLAAGSALNVENVSTQTANSQVADASVTSASVHPVSAPVSAPSASPVQALAAEPPPAPPAPPETPVRRAQPLAAVEPEPASVPVPHQTVSAAPVAAPAAPIVPPPTAAIAPPPVAAIAPPPAAPLAAPIAPPPAAPAAAIVPPPAAPIVPLVPPPAAPAAAIAPPPAAPIALPPAAPIALPAAAPPTAPLAAPPAPMAPPPAPVVPPDPAGPPPPQDPMAVVSNLLFGGLP
jgi:hypothetical protein